MYRYHILLISYCLIHPYGAWYDIIITIHAYKCEYLAQYSRLTINVKMLIVVAVAVACGEFVLTI